MILKSHKMDIVMPLLMILAIIDGFIGMDPQDIKWTPALKEKLFEVWHKTSPHVKDHPQRMLDVWNRENQSYKVSDKKALHKLTMSLIEDRKRKAKLRELGQIEWSRQMEVDLLYLRHKLQNEERVMMLKKLRARWKLLYPHHKIRVETLDKYSRYLRNEEFQPTEEELRKAKEKYDNLFVADGEAEQLKRNTKWTNERKTDLLYIAQRLEADQLPLRSNLKMRWNQMNTENNSPTENTLFNCLNKLKSVGFTPKAVDVEDAKTRYDKLPPISTQDLKHKEKCCETDDYPNVSAHSDPHGWNISQHHAGHPTSILEHREPSSSHHVDHTYHQSMNANDTAGSTSSYYRGDHDLGDKIPLPSQYSQDELHHQHLDDPIYSPTYYGDFFNPPEYDVHPFTSSFDPYMYNPSYDLGQGSSSQPAGSSRGQHSPKP